MGADTKPLPAGAGRFLPGMDEREVSIILDLVKRVEPVKILRALSRLTYAIESVACAVRDEEQPPWQEPEEETDEIPDDQEALKMIERAWKKMGT